MSLELRGITKRYELRGRAPVTAVDELSLTFEDGLFTTLLGPSGCGKTTLLRVIAGFEQPSAGAVLHDGRMLNHVPPYRRGFPMVFQSYALFPHMTVAENIAYGLRIRRLPRAELEQRVARVLALLGLETQRDRMPSQISGGQQQRVALARALVLEPRIILLDEPLSNLDAELRVAMRGEIRALQQRLGITAIYVTHDQEEALAVSDRIVVLNRGRIEQAGTPADVFERPRTEFVARFMGNRNVFPVARRDGDRIELFGHTLAARAPDGATHVLVRPDAIVPSAERGAYRAVVEQVTFLGSRRSYTLRLPDSTLLTLERAWGDAMSSLQEGAEVAFDLAPEKLHFV